MKRSVPSFYEGDVSKVERLAMQSLLKFVPGEVSDSCDKHICVTELHKYKLS
jgi:hypothetical protein